MDNTPKKPGFLTNLFIKGGAPVLLLLSLLSIPVGFLAIHWIAWPLLAAYFLGVHLTDGTALLLIAAPFVLMFIAARFFPTQGDFFFSWVGKLYGLGLASFMALFFASLFVTVVGFPAMLALNYCFPNQLPYWSFLPIGIVLIAAYAIIGNKISSRN